MHQPTNIRPEQAAWRRRYPFGYFSSGGPDPIGPRDHIVDARWLRDGRKVILLRDVVFVDPDGVRWVAPCGRVVDGLSTPRVLWRIQPPFSGKAREASVIHDAACEDRVLPSWQVHRAFYFAMRANGVGWLAAWARWLSVRLFGPRFKGVT